MERQSWCSHQSPVPIPLLFIILAATDTLLQVRRLSPSPSLPITPRCCFLLVATPDASAKPKGRPVTKQPFHPSVHGFVRADLRSSRSILEYFVKISARKFESEFSFFFIAEDKEERADRFFSLYAFAPAASRNKCAFGPIIVAVAARKDRDQDDDHDRT